MRSKSPKVQGLQGPGVPRSQGPKDQDTSNSHSNTSLTLKKVHLVSCLKHNSLHVTGRSCSILHVFYYPKYCLNLSFPLFY